MLFFKVRVLKLSAMNFKKYSNFLFFSSHQVIVLNVVDGVEDLPIDFASKIQDSNNSETGNQKFYVAAELKNIPGNEMSWEFSVGDGKTYGAYRNKELQIGEDYIVYQRAMTYDNDVSNFLTSYNPPEAFTQMALYSYHTRNTLQLVDLKEPHRKKY